MKNLITTLFILSLGIVSTFGQAELFNLQSKNLHKKVRKTIEHYYSYDEESGGFIKSSVNINRYNDAGNLVETYYVYDGKYGEPKPVKKLYNYNSKGQLISTTDISDEIGKYASDFVYSYDSSGNLVKKETIYKSGGGSYSIFTNDSKGREINEKTYDKDGKLTSESNTSYNGKEKTHIYTSYSNKDGSIIGNYTTIYEDDVKKTYKTESKYSDSKTSYFYDKYGNMLKSEVIDKSKNYVYTYDYEYEKRNNWIKKHYKSGKFQYFYFREIHFDNGDLTGSVEFDKQFINRLGNFPNVNVVTLKKKPINNPKNTTTINTNNRATISNKTWDFDYVFLDKKVKKLQGKLALKNLNSNSLQINTDATISINFSGSTFTYDLYVTDFKELEDKYEWMLSSKNNESVLIWVYKKLKPLKDEDTGVIFNINGLLNMKESNGNYMSFYLK